MNESKLYERSEGALKASSTNLGIQQAVLDSWTRQPKEAPAADAARNTKDSVGSELLFTAQGHKDLYQRGLDAVLEYIHKKFDIPETLDWLDQLRSEALHQPGSNEWPLTTDQTQHLHDLETALLDGNMKDFDTLYKNDAGDPILMQALAKDLYNLNISTIVMDNQLVIFNGDTGEGVSFSTQPGQPPTGIQIQFKPDGSPDIKTTNHPDSSFKGLEQRAIDEFDKVHPIQLG